MKTRMLLVVPLLLCVVPLALTPALAQTTDQTRNGSAQVTDLEQRVQALTARLRQDAAALSGFTAGASRSAAETTIRELALQRQAAMVALMQIAPAAALRVAMPANAREQLPVGLENYVERDVALTGTLEVLGVLRDDGGPGVEYRLTAGDRELHLSVAKMPDEYVTGTVMSVQGILLDDWVAAFAENITIQKAVTASPSTLSEPEVRTTLVININFPDRQIEPWTIDTAADLFVNTVAAWYEEGSYGQMTMASDVAGWFTIEAGSSSCATTTWRQQGEEAARAAGYDPSSYTHVVIAFPRVPACAWAGLGQVPGRYTWLNNAMNLRVAVHELGHNLGLFHSHSWQCSDDPLTGQCTLTEYGDRFDVMGSGGQAHYHAAYRAYLGWIPPEDVITIGPDDGEITLGLRSGESSYGPRVLRVQRSGRNDSLHIEAREAVGFDAVLEQFPVLLNGVAVYLGTNMRNQSIIDINHTTPTVADAALQFGETLYDIEGDVTISALYSAEGEAVVSVHYGPPASWTDLTSMSNVRTLRSH